MAIKVRKKRTSAGGFPSQGARIEARNRERHQNKALLAAKMPFQRTFNLVSRREMDKAITHVIAGAGEGAVANGLRPLVGRQDLEDAVCASASFTVQSPTPWHTTGLREGGVMRPCTQAVEN